MIIIAPLDSPQIVLPTPAPPKPLRLDWIDQLLLDRLADAGSCPTWTFLNAVEAEHPAGDRTRGRLFRLQLWDRVKRLRRLGMVFPVGRNQISASKPAPVAREPAVRRRRRTVAKSASAPDVSAVLSSGVKEVGRQPNQVHYQLEKGIAAPRTPVVDVEKTKTVATPDDVTAAASVAAVALAQKPRRPKRTWSGWIAATRSYCGMPIKLATGEHVFAFGALRGRVVWSREPGVLTNSIDGARVHWGVVAASTVEIVRNPHAALLGRRKRGVRERRSLLKIASARANGLMPVRPGSRPRGRPLSPHQSPRSCSGST